MTSKAVISLTTGLEDPEKVTVAFLVAVGAAEAGRPTLMFQAKEAVRLALEGVATGVACDGCPPLRDLLARYRQAGGRYMVCPSASTPSSSTKAACCPTPNWPERYSYGSGSATKEPRHSATKTDLARRHPTVTARTRSDDALDSASSPKARRARACLRLACPTQNDPFGA